MTAIERQPRTVGVLMTRDPIVVGVDTPLAEAADLMDFYRISGLPVVDWNGALVGVISQADLVRARTTESLWQAWSGLAVRHLMTGPAVSVLSTAAFEEAAEVMERLHIHRVVVVDADGETPIGLLSISDLVRVIAEEGLE